MWQQFPDSHHCDVFHRKDGVETFLVHKGPDKKKVMNIPKKNWEDDSKRVVSTKRRKQLSTHIHISVVSCFRLQNRNTHTNYFIISWSAKIMRQQMMSFLTACLSSMLLICSLCVLWGGTEKKRMRKHLVYKYNLLIHN